MLRAIARIIQLGNLFSGDITRTTEQARIVRGRREVPKILVLKE